MFKVADKNAAKKPSARLSDNVKSIEETVINTNAKAVKWNEEKSLKKKKYFFTGREDSNDIRDDLSSQSLRDRQAKDKMLSDEESKIYFYTTATNRVMDSNKIQGKSYHTNNYRSNEDSESILEKFSSSSSSQIKILTVSYVFMVLSLLPFTSIYV